MKDQNWHIGRSDEEAHSLKVDLLARELLVGVQSYTEQEGMHWDVQLVIAKD